VNDECQDSIDRNRKHNFVVVIFAWLRDKVHNIITVCHSQNLLL